MSVLEVNHVSVRYLTGDFKDIGLKEYVMRKAKGNYHVHEFWADRDVTFSLEKGDMLGIIGTNGAGKSTILKVISGIMEPSKGYVKREGNVAALLELASGFDGELTVRENTYLRGAMLGFTRDFMDQTYAEIISFAELEEFQDRPFKQLSSGMKSRLAFSIASLVKPQILILDEVLSVGDGAFRQKSEAKMQEIIRGGATTILVSHSVSQIKELCNKVLWLHKGDQVAFGEAQEICDRYERFLDGKITLEELESKNLYKTFPGKPRQEYTTQAVCTSPKILAEKPPGEIRKTEVRKTEDVRESRSVFDDGNVTLQKGNWERLKAFIRQYGILIVPFLTFLALLRASPMMYDGWYGPSYYSNYGGLLNWLGFLKSHMWQNINGRMASNFFSGILESFSSEIPLDIVNAFIMVGILLCILKIFPIRNKTIATLIYTAAIVLTPYEIRVYVIQIALLQYVAPILFMLLAIVLIRKFEETKEVKYLGWLYPLSAIACTWMENSSVAYGVVLALLCVANVRHIKKLNWRLWGVVVVSAICGLFMMFAPGTRANRIDNAGLTVSAFLGISPERIHNHLTSFFKWFIYEGVLANLLLAATFTICLLLKLRKGKTKAGRLRGSFLCAANIFALLVFLYLGSYTHEFQYTATIRLDLYYQTMNMGFLQECLVLLYFCWIISNVFYVFGKNRTSLLLVVYALTSLLCTIPTTQVGARIQSPVYFIFACLATAMAGATFPERIQKSFLVKASTFTVAVLFLLAMDFQMQLCQRLSITQKERMDQVNALRQAQFLKTAEDRYYRITTFNARDAYLSGAATIGTYHYPLFLSRYGLEADTKLIFTNETLYMTPKTVPEGCVGVEVTNSRPGDWRYTYTVFYRPSTQEDYKEFSWELDLTQSEYVFSANQGIGAYRIQVLCTELQSGGTVTLTTELTT